MLGVCVSDGANEQGFLSYFRNLPEVRQNPIVFFFIYPFFTSLVFFRDIRL